MEKFKKEEKNLKFEDIDLSGTYSYADYLNWEFDERLELIKGKIFTMSPGPATMHQRVSMRLGAELYHFLQSKICEVFCSSF
jgi:hypothetical protein